MISHPDMLAAISEYSTGLGEDALLVQGAGGNISWKDGDTLWVKASGTWLANAKKDNIFVPVNLLHLTDNIGKGNFAVTPLLGGASAMRPSIETVLHGLMPHTVVLHLHPIEILAYLVRKNVNPTLKNLLDGLMKWGIVEYAKPGEYLAKSISDLLRASGAIDVVFLNNHGIVIGGETIEEVDSTLQLLLSKLKNTIAPWKNFEALPSKNIAGFSLVKDEELNQLVTSPQASEMVRKYWALFPDHVVFLGGQAVVVRQESELDIMAENGKNVPFIFVEGKYVLQSDTATMAQMLQLRCYYEVVRRQTSADNIQILSEQQVQELINWEAEAHRIKLNS